MRVSEVVNAITCIAAPLLGETLARSAVEAQRAKLGLPADELDEQHVRALVHKFGLGLNVFVGRETATSVVAQIESALEGLRLGRDTR